MMEKRLPGTINRTKRRRPLLYFYYSVGNTAYNLQLIPFSFIWTMFSKYSINPAPVF